MHYYQMTRKLITIALAAGFSSAALAQEVTPVWVQHLKGLVNVDPADKLPIVVQNVGAPYAANGIGRSQQFSLTKMRRYDSTRFLMGVRENGIDEQAANLTQEQKDLAAAYPDRSVIWVSAANGKPMGVAHVFGLRPVVATGQANNNDFFSNWDVDDGPEGQRVLYSTHKNVILRWAPKAGGGWETTPTCAWTEPNPDAIDCAGNPLDGTSGGDGYTSWRWRDFRVSGSGANTVFVAGGGTWRASMHVQIFKTTDGLKFYPIARFNDRDGGRKGAYSQGGLSSHMVQYGLDSAHPNLMTAYHGRYPGAGWEARPSRFIVDPDAPADVYDDTYNPDGLVMVFQVNNEAWGNLPAFQWESAGANGVPIDHAVDGVEYYDGNWGGILDANAGVDYVVNYAFPSWNNQFGSIKKPGWIGVHRLDGSIASNAGYKFPFTEMDVQSVDAGTEVGNDFGYDGDVGIYPDQTAPANLDKSEVAWVGSGYGYGLFTVQNVAATITAQPQDVTVTENGPLSLVAAISGSPNKYQWYKDGVALDGTATDGDGNLIYPRTLAQGVNKPTLRIAKAQVPDSGKYKLVAVNPLGTVTTREAQVTVLVDNVPPTVALFKNARSGDASYVRIDYSEAVTPETAGDANNYKLNGGAVTGARSISTTAAIVYIPHVNPGAEATLTISGVRDIASGGGNAIAANTPVKIKGPALTDGYLLWEFWPGITGSSYNDLLNDAAYPGQPARWESMTAFNTDAAGLSQVADTFGARISGWLTPTENGIYRFFIRSDDGSVLYLSSGADPAAANMIAWENGCCQAFLEPTAVDPAGNGSYQTSETIQLQAGTSYYIALVYKEGGGGDWAQMAWRKEGDTTAAASLPPLSGNLLKSYRVVYEAPKFETPVISGANVTIKWTGGGTLLESADLKTWTNVAGNPSSPYAAPLPTGAGQKFYRVKQ
jgi:hypothetical protein